MLTALVLAAGLSSRMGEPKQVLRWKSKPMVRHVVETLATSVDEVVVVTGYAHERVVEALESTSARCVPNPAFAHSGMLRSLQVGLAEIKNSEAILVALGDQPQLQVEVIQRVVARWRQAQALIVAPSYQRRRGHPLLIAQPLFAELLALPPESSLRQFLQIQAAHINYVEVETDSILRDIDTPADYQREQPKP